MSIAGDVNNDHYEDIIIAADNASSKGTIGAGQSYVIFGKSSGFISPLDLSTLNGSNVFAITYNEFGQVNSLSYASVLAAGDVNNDGFDDLAIGSPYASPSGRNQAGKTFVLFGKASGFTSPFDLSTLNGINGFIINGITTLGNLGSKMIAAVDLNNDGYNDIVTGSFSYSANTFYVLFGKSSGFISPLELDTLDGINVVGIRGTGIGSSVSSAGDINNDGYSDIIISAALSDANGKRGAGKTYVICGRPNGLSAFFDLSALDGSNGFVANGMSASDYSGASVNSAGDINNDGYSDIIIGADEADPNIAKPFSGKIHVVFGYYIPSYSPSFTPSSSSPTFTPTLSITPSVTPSFTTSISMTGTVTLTPSVTQSSTDTASATPSKTMTSTLSLSITHTATTTITSTSSPTFTASPPISVSPTLSPSPSTSVTFNEVTISELATSFTGTTINEAFRITSGNITISGGGGQDKFIIAYNPSGIVRITDFDDNEIIDFSGISDVHSYSDLTITQGSVIISLNHGQQVIIINKNPADVDETNFIFAPAAPSSSLHQEAGSSLNIPLIVGVAVGVAIFIASIAAVIWKFLHRTHDTPIEEIASPSVVHLAGSAADVVEETLVIGENPTFAHKIVDIS